MSLGRSALPLPVLRWSSAGVAPDVEAMYYVPAYERGLLLAADQAATLTPAFEPTDLTPEHEPDTLLADDQPAFMEPS